jgi:A/G-specific adenine glycosylase
VLTRFFALEGWPATTANLKQLWDWAEQLTPEKRVTDFNQVMMDLGAMVCTRSKPKCDTCPLHTECKAYQQGRTAELPAKKPKKDKPTRDTWLLILRAPDGGIYLEKRPQSGIWGGLHSFPQFENRDQAEQHLALAGLNCEPEDWTPFRHTFSHYHLNIHPLFVTLAIEPNTVREAASDAGLWYHPGIANQVGLSAPVKALLNKLF